MDKDDIKLIVLIHHFFRWVLRWIHRLSNVITDFLSGIMERFTKKLASKNEIAAKKMVQILEIIQIIIILLAFLFVKDRIRLFFNICYTTPSGSIAGLAWPLISTNLKTSVNDPSLTGFFLGDTITWITCGIQTIFVKWYSYILDSYEENKYKKKLGQILFTFFIGIVLTLIISFLYGSSSPIQKLANIPGLGVVIKAALAVFAAIIFVVALDNAISNFKDMYLTSIVICILFIPILNYIGNSPLGKIAMPDNMVEFFYEFTVLIIFVFGFLIGKGVQKIVSKYKKKKIDLDEVSVKRTLDSALNKRGAAENKQPNTAGVCCICREYLDNEYIVLIKDQAGIEYRVEKNCQYALNVLSQSNRARDVNQALRYIKKYYPNCDSITKQVIQPCLNRGFAIQNNSRRVWNNFLRS